MALKLQLIYRYKNRGERELTVGFRQRTIGDSVSCTGIGLHSGEKVRLTIKPAPPVINNFIDIVS